jgi:multisubunit Na+/H+ antiporter MnhG subunit
VSSPAHLAAVVLVSLGTGVIVAAALAALLARDVLHRVHLVTVITSLGGPLLAAGLSVQNGWGLTTASILLPTALLFLTGPALSAATVRLAASVDGRIEAETPQ